MNIYHDDPDVDRMIQWVLQKKDIWVITGHKGSGELIQVMPPFDTANMTLKEALEQYAYLKDDDWTIYLTGTFSKFRTMMAPVPTNQVTIE